LPISHANLLKDSLDNLGSGEGKFK
jgi:hypothetical protein